MENTTRHHDHHTLSDIIHLVANAGTPPTTTTTAQYFPGTQHLMIEADPQPYDDKIMMMKMKMMMMMDSSQAINSISSDISNISGLCGGGNGGSEMMEMCCVDDGGGFNNNMRWPRQETLTLLEIRSRLDPKFKEATHKGPLWAEISRIMAEEHGYQRSGKKCKEKFENLYKYYKKTKAGKVGRMEGKHYRFFRQLEALYGETSNPVSASKLQFLQNTTNNVDTIAQANQEGNQNEKANELLNTSIISSELETSSSECHQNGITINAFMENSETMTMKKKKNDISSHRRDKKKWKLKASEFITSEMKRIVEMQEAWFEKMFNALEHKEEEMQSRREKWRKLEAARHEEECRFWANEHVWIKTRYVLLTDLLQKFMMKDLEETDAVKYIGNLDEIGREIERTKKQDDKEEIEEYVVATECNKKHEENSRACPNVQHFNFMYPNHDGLCSNSNAGTAAHAHESCFQHLMN